MAFHLEALGGLRLIGAEGQVVQAQRRRLALLALLAAAGERGLSREQIVGYLWPDAAEDNAKHALNQLLYGIRRSLSPDAVHGVDSLRLDPDVVDCDVRRFECALSAGELGEAVALYRGPFLNGFYLADAPQFEPHVERERARLAAAHADTLERLAADAERRGDVPAAVGWRRMLVELDPLDARRATALMRALAAANDSAGALAHGRTYESLVRHELDASPDPAVVALADEIRARSEGQSVAARAADSRRAAAPLVGAAAASLVPGADSPVADSPDEPALPRPGAGGLESYGDPPRPTAATRVRRSRLVLVYGTAALALAAAVSFGASRLAHYPTGRAAAAASSRPSIAVLPLTNLSADPADAALAGGMTEELTSTLSRAGNLRVVARHSASGFAEGKLDVRRVADSLGVSYILEGGLQKVGPRIRLQVRLIDARDGSTRWSETYDRAMGDVFAVQDDLSRAVSRELDLRIAGGRAATTAGRYTPSVAAYEWYLRGMDLSLMRSTAGRQRALEYFERAIAADSNFAAAHAGLVRVYLGDAGDTPGNQNESYARAERAALRAVALDPALAEAHGALGWVRSGQRHWTAAEAEFKQAIALDPHAPRAYEGLARAYLWAGRPAEQLAAARIGLEIDPFSHAAIRELALALAANGRCDEALERLLPLKSLSPPAGVAGVIRGQCFAAKQMWAEAIAEFRWAGETTDAKAALAFLGYALARSGRRDEAATILSDLLAGRRYSHGAFGVATVYAGLGDYDATFAWLDKSVDERTMRPYIMGPLFEDLRRDARFARLKERMGP